MNGCSAEVMFSGADLLKRARSRLSLTLPPDVFASAGSVGGDHVLDRHAPLPSPRRAAAVLVPVVNHRREATVLLTQRVETLRTHSGQIAFPGGKIDETDGSPAAAALREAWEEVGLVADAVESLGYLDPYLTGTGFLIIPTLAVVEPPLRLSLNPAEVANAFEVPLAFLMEPVNHLRHARSFGGTLRSFYAMPYGERYIWGATAGMLRNLYERLYL